MTTLSPKPPHQIDNGPHLRLRHLLAEMGLTQQEASRRIGKNYTTFNKYVSITPYRSIPGGILYALQARLGISRRYIELGLEPKLVKPDSTSITDIPLIKPEGRATFSPDELPHQPRMRLYNWSEPSTTAPIAIEVSREDAMGDQLNAGAKVLAYRVDDADWDTLTGAVAAVYYPAGFTIKRITSNNLPISDTLTLHSDSSVGGSFTLPRSAIRALYRLQTILESDVV